MVLFWLRPKLPQLKKKPSEGLVVTEPRRMAARVRPGPVFECGFCEAKCGRLPMLVYGFGSKEIQEKKKKNYKLQFFFLFPFGSIG